MAIQNMAARGSSQVPSEVVIATLSTPMMTSVEEILENVK